MNVGIRDSTYVLDGLLYHESDLRIEEHYTDTAGFTDHVFALGEGKTALDRLCDQLESNPAYAVHDHVELAVRLREALGHYYARNRAQGAAILTRVSRELWQRCVDGE